MKINWKIRFKHGPFLVALFSALLLLAQQVSRIFGYEITEEMSEQVTGVFNTVLTALVLIGVVSDPTTKGASDSPLAMSYDEPKERGKFE